MYENHVQNKKPLVANIQSMINFDMPVLPARLQHYTLKLVWTTLSKIELVGWFMVCHLPQLWLRQ
jgi:hypothetical protein